MSLLVCMVTLIVNGNLTLAFTLGGTLAIIRFRTVVDDTRDNGVRHRRRGRRHGHRHRLGLRSVDRLADLHGVGAESR